MRKFLLINILILSLFFGINLNSQSDANVNYFLETALGKVPNHTFISLVGENTSIGTTYETIWPLGGRYSAPTTASILSLLSDSSEDTGDGTGARTVTVRGLNSDYVAIEETLTMNGVTTVNTTLLFLRVNELAVTTSDGNKGAVGNVTVRNGSGILAIIEPNKNISRQGYFTVPADNILLLYSLALSVGKEDESKTAILVTNPTNQVTYEIAVFYNFQNSFSIPTIVYIPAKHDVEFVCLRTSVGKNIRMQMFGNFILRKE